jgi:uncharacterized membrane protein
MAFCRSCGLELTPEAKFCPRCGTPVATGGAPGPATAPAMPSAAPAAPPAASALEGLRSDIRMRAETDRILSPLWVFLPLLAIPLFAIGGLFGAVLGGPFLGALFVLPVAGFAITVVMIYFVYLLIKRRNRHFAREHHLVADLAAALRGVAAKRGANVEVPVGAMERTLRDMQMEETEKSAALWAILMLIPFVNIVAALYILYFLTKDYFKHERREDMVLQDVGRGMSALNLAFDWRRPVGTALPERSYVLYLVLTIVTLGLFGIYWWYVLVRDPNAHFQTHPSFEEPLLQSLSTAA